MILVLIVATVLAIAGLAVFGYRMGPPPGGRAITERDRRLQVERADQAAFRRQANLNLRSDRDEAVESLAAAAVRMARISVDAQPSLNETEALAEALVGLDRLERDAAETTIGPLIPEMVSYLAWVGVLNQPDLSDPELAALTSDNIVVNPGMVVRIVGVADLNHWPRID